MQKKLEKLEEKINQILLIVINWLSKVLYKITPSFVHQKIEAFKKKQQIYKGKLKQQKQLLIQSCVNKSKLTFTELKKHKEKFQSVSVKEIAADKIQKSKNKLLATSFKAQFELLFQKLEQLNTLFEKIGKPQLLVATLAVMLIVVGVTSVYDSSREIYSRENPGRIPANVQEYDEKPDYLSYQKKSATIFKIEVPTFKTNKESLRNLTIDFTLLASNRFTKQFLEFHSEKLKDYFLTNVEPFETSFPLEEEGRIVLKEKILSDLNRFLIEEKVEGEVKEVYIIYSVGY
jgi:flagellar basal body-associated protein FliL